MRCIRIAKPDGTAWTHHFDGPRTNVGRDADNDIVLPDPAVSARHCLLELDGATITVKDRGTANGTFLNNSPLIEPRPLVEGDRLYVGPFLLELVSLAPEAAGAWGASRPVGPMVRLQAQDAEHTRRLRRLDKWASEWEVAGRPANLLLRGRLLRNARELVAREPQLDPTTRAFVRRSRRRSLRGRFIGVAGSVAVVSVVGVFAAGGLAARLEAWDGQDADAAGESEPEPEPAPLVAAPVAAGSTAPPVQETWIDHVVIPAETLDDIARRYDVSVANVARWNGLNTDAPQIDEGTSLRIKPKKTPLPQQQIVFELDRKYDWKTLSNRFDVEIDKLRAYNPELSDLARGERVVVWINPQPYGRRSSAFEVPEYDIRPDALSVGRPNEGRLTNGIQMPTSDLYQRRAPFIMFGSSHTIETLQTAIARFRQDLAFDGVVVVADISRPRGGHFPPHKSHQAGRDVDIWMPTLKGVYKRNFLGRDRKPQPNEIDWFATWGLVRALIETGEIVHIFLEYELQAKLHHAARAMNTTEEELARAMQYPRGKFATGVVGHSAGHTGHIHVRFKCGPNDVGCVDNVGRSAEEEE